MSVSASKLWEVVVCVGVWTVGASTVHYLNQFVLPTEAGVPLAGLRTMYIVTRSKIFFEFRISSRYALGMRSVA